MNGPDHVVDLSRLLRPNALEALGLLFSSVDQLMSALARFRTTGIANDEGLSALWELADSLFNLSWGLRDNLQPNEGNSAGLFRCWDDTTGMRIWRFLSAIQEAGDAVEEVAYRLTRICEGPDQPEV
jgi:hypothetical protein